MRARAERCALSVRHRLGDSTPPLTPANPPTEPDSPQFATSDTSIASAFATDTMQHLDSAEALASQSRQARFEVAERCVEMRLGHDLEWIVSLAILP